MVDIIKQVCDFLNPPSLNVSSEQLTEQKVIENQAMQAADCAIRSGYQAGLIGLSDYPLIYTAFLYELGGDSTSCTDTQIIIDS